MYTLKIQTYQGFFMTAMFEIAEMLEKSWE